MSLRSISTTLPLLLLIICLAGIAYWPGLTGPLVLDDDVNLGPVQAWMNGEIAAAQVIFENHSGPLGRSVAMATFVATAAAFGTSVFAFKATNLALHLLIGTLVFALVRNLGRRDSKLPITPEALALGVTAVWLLHPMLVGTVLYVVQRMAMLSALFTLCAMLAYLRGRTQLENDNGGTGVGWLFVGVPVFTALAAFSKENGLLAPMLCGVIEWAYFRPAAGGRRPRPVRIFVALFIAMPVTAALALLIFHPGFYFDGYANRPFTPLERTLTQGRVLFDYVGSLLLPAGPDFSLYRDSYPLSSGLLKPWTTSVAWAGWIAVVFAALWLRRTMPSFSAGIGLFLIGHAMESSIFPLLIYFEHRNYLPAIGLLLAAAALLAHGYHAIHQRLTHPRRIAAAGFLGLLLAFAGSVFARSVVWQDKETLVQQSLKAYPDSRFARMEMATLAMNRSVPDTGLAREQYRFLLKQERPSTRMIGRLGLIAVDCFSDGGTDPQAIDEALATTPEGFEADLIKAVQSLASIVRTTNCVGLSPGQYADALVDFSERVADDRPHFPIARLRYRAARLYLAGDDADLALVQARKAWALDNDTIQFGMLTAQLSARKGNDAEARQILEEIAPRILKTDRIGQQLLSALRRELDDAG